MEVAFHLENEALSTYGAGFSVSEKSSRLIWHLPEVSERRFVTATPVAQEDLRRHEAAVVEIS